MTVFIKSSLIIFAIFLCVVAQANPDTSAIRKYLDSSYSYSRTNPEISFHNAELAYNLAGKRKENKGWKGKARLQMAVLYYLQGEYDTCELILNEANQLLLNTDFKKDLAKSIRIQGILYEMKGQYSEAMVKFLETKDVCVEIGDSLGIADAYLSLGIVKHRIKRTPECLAAYQKAESIYKSLGAEIKLGATYNNIGSYYNNNKVFDTAIYYLKLSAEINRKYNNLPTLQSSYHNIGTNYRELGLSDSAIYYYHLAIDMNRKDFYNTSLTYAALASEYLRRNKYDSASHYFNETIKLAAPNSYYKPVIESYDGLYQLEYKRKNYKRSLEYYAEFSRYSDSLEKNIYNENLAEAESKYKNLEQQIEISNLKQQQEVNDATLAMRQKYNVGLLIAVLFFVVVSIFLLLNRKKLSENRKELREINEDLDTKRKELEESNRKLIQTMGEKDELLGVLAHDIRAPFSKIISLLEVIKLEEASEDDMKLYLGMMESISIDGLKLIQDMVDLSRIHHGDLFSQSLAVKEFEIKPIIEKQLSFYSGQINQKQLQVDFRMTNNSKLVNRADFLERVLDNLLSNAIKYSPIGGLVSITVKEENSQITVGVQDQGQGFTESDMSKLFLKFQRLSAQPTGNESSTGLGLYIAKKLSEAMRGELKLLSKENEGAYFEISLPLN